jgi:predicted transcriptional regulator
MPEPVPFNELRQKLIESDRLSGHFHVVNRILPEDQVVTSVPPDTKAGDALKLMEEHGFSQIPVVEGDSVLGLFSYRAFALEVANSTSHKLDPTSLSVEEFLAHDTPQYASLDDEFRGLISILDTKDAVIVSGPENLVAILTPMDVLRYLYSVANVFVLLEEIEFTVRALIMEALTDPDMFSACVTKALSESYKDKDKELPQRVEDMTFDEYIWLIRHGDNWPYFEPVFGSSRDRVNGRLSPIRELRNDVFHFRRELSSEDHQRLSACRDWLFRCIRKTSARKGGAL